jgi:hypothetical protein
MYLYACNDTAKMRAASETNERTKGGDLRLVDAPGSVQLYLRVERIVGLRAETVEP